jgi:hypothetical protein
LLARHYCTGQPNLNTIKFLRSLEIKTPVHILEAQGGYGIYVGRNYNRVAEYDKNANFCSFVHDTQIDMVVLSDGLRSDDRFFNDPEWLLFIEDPGKFGFIHLDIPHVPNRSLLVTKALLSK